MQDVVEGSPQEKLQKINAAFIEGYPTMMPPEYSSEFLDAMLEVLCRDERIKWGEIRDYTRIQHYEVEEFLDLFETWSRYQVLEQVKKDELLTLVRNRLKSQELSTTIEYRTGLLMAQFHA